jgi:hypothetical protein
MMTKHAVLEAIFQILLRLFSLIDRNIIINALCRSICLFYMRVCKILPTANLIIILLTVIKFDTNSKAHINFMASVLLFRLQCKNLGARHINIPDYTTLCVDNLRNVIIHSCLVIFSYDGD